MFAVSQLSEVQLQRLDTSDFYGHLNSHAHINTGRERDGGRKGETEGGRDGGRDRRREGGRQGQKEGGRVFLSLFLTFNLAF